MERVNLQEGWRFAEANSNEWTPVSVPGTVLSGLLEAGKMQDPYYRENEYEARELLAKDYVFETDFCISEEQLNKKHCVLVCEGLDTLADVYVNEKLVGKADNMHRTWRFDCRDALQKENHLRIYFHSALTYIREHEATPGKEITYEPTGGILGNQYIRKAHSMFGWDWGAQLPDIGIWRDLYLECYNAGRIEDVVIRQKHTWKERPQMGELSQEEYIEAVEQSDTVSLSVEVVPEQDTNLENTKVIVTLTDPKGVQLEQVVLPTIKEAVCAEILVAQPKLWWCNGLGGQPLYKVQVSLVADNQCVLDSKEYSIGLRELTVSTKKDEWGNEFAFVINGIYIFSMGADYIPEDCIYPWITKERIEALIRSSVKANYNMLRVWGGGYYPSDTFYDLCDQYGLIVWQDLMYACNVYDFTEEFEENIRQETVDNVRRLRHHASLGLWCGNNELETAWDCWGISETHSPALKADYIKQFEYVLPKVTKAEDQATFYWPSSPSSGGCMEAPADDNRGDCHYWDVWHGMKPFSDYRSHYFRFCSEFGFQSFPERKTIDTFALPQDCNIFSPVMESHQKNGTANGKILYYISENFRYPKDFDSLVYVSQVLQGVAIKAGVDHWRANRGRCMGALYWQLNDNWPVASWASIDYFGRWKALHYMAARFFAPKAGYIYTEGTKAVISAANETLENQSLTVTVRIRDVELNVLFEETVETIVKAQSSIHVLERDFADVIGSKKRRVFAEAVYTWQDGTISTEAESFVPYKHMDLLQPQIETSVTENDGTIEIQISADCFAPFVWLETEEDVIFSDNCFDLTSEETKTIYIRKEDVLSGKVLSADDVRKTLKVRSLRDTYEQ